MDTDKTITVKAKDLKEAFISYERQKEGREISVKDLAPRWARFWALLIPSAKLSSPERVR